MSELTVLQAMRLKGRIAEPQLVATLGEGASDVAQTVLQLTAAGLLVEGTSLRLSPEGRARLNMLLAQERSGIDQDGLAQSYGEFRTVNNVAGPRCGRSLGATAWGLCRQAGLSAGESQSRRHRMVHPADHRLVPHRVVRTARRADRRLGPHP